MLSTVNRKARRQLVQRRVRRKVSGSAARPRLLVQGTLKHFYAHVVDDVAGKTLCSVSTLHDEVKGKAPKGGNIAAAIAVGDVLGSQLKSKGIETIVFDRGGRVYHGRVKAIAEAVRKHGIVF